jgi:hypothetical protein
MRRLTRPGAREFSDSSLPCSSGVGGRSSTCPLAISTTLAACGESLGRLRGSAIYLPNLSKFPKVTATETQAAVRSASVRIASVAIPKASCATIPDRTAMATAATSNKMGTTTRPMQAQ